MVNDLQDLLRRNVEGAPPDHLDLDRLMRDGRRRVRRRRGAAGAVALGAAAVVGAAVLAWPGGSADHADPADTPPRPDAPTITLDGATPAVQGRDYDVITSVTDDNLDRANGRYLDGVTDDGLVLVHDGPSETTGLRPRYALLDPDTGDLDRLPDPGVGQSTARPVELGADRLLLVGTNRSGRRLVAYVLDRGTQTWQTTTWPGLPNDASVDPQLGPDGRLHLRIPATRGKVPEGGWPTGNGGEADDSDAEGDTYELWSASPTDGSDIRDEHLRVGDVALTDHDLVWTDSTNGHAGLVHVRDLSTGAEHSFDPHAGAKCNLLTFGATDERVVMGQYCGDYGGDVRDDRVQILTTDGEQVATLQQSGVEGGLPAGSSVVAVAAYGGYGHPEGAYVYDLTSDRLLRLSDGVSKFALSGTALGGRQIFWDTPVGKHGATQWLADLK